LVTEHITRIFAWLEAVDQLTYGKREAASGEVEGLLQRGLSGTAFLAEAAQLSVSFPVARVQTAETEQVEWRFVCAVEIR
jgi:hypothetical protein